MIGWIVEKISSCGWRMKWRRLRPVTTRGVRDAPTAGPAAWDGAGQRTSAALTGGASPGARPAAAAARSRSRRPRSAARRSAAGRRRRAWAGAGRGRSRRSPRGAAPPPRPRSARDRRRGAGSVSRSGRSSGSGSPQPTPASTAWASSRWRGARSSSTSRIWPPTRSLSSLPVPCAITRRGRSPRSGRRAGRPPRGTGWSAGASSPRATSSRTIAQIWLRLRGSRPVVGSSRNRIRGRVSRLDARSSRRRIPPE